MRVFWIVPGSIAAVLLLLCASGIVYELYHDGRARSLAPAGEMITVDGRSQHLICTGSGTPSVLLEAGAFSISASWALVQPQVAAFTRVCAYDRAGLGWSAPTTEGLTGPDRVRQVRALLDAANEDGPFVVVGHSYGGVLGRAFVHQFPEDIVGLVLVDAASPGQGQAFADAGVIWSRAIRWSESLPAMAVHFGLPRLLDQAYLEETYADLPSDALLALTHFAFEVDHRHVAGAEAALGVNADWALSLPSEPSALGSRPIAIVTAGRQPREWFASDQDHAAFSRIWSEAQGRLAGLSTKVNHVTIPDADHNSLLGLADHAAQTVSAIEWAVSQSRAQPLSSDGAGQHGNGG